MCAKKITPGNSDGGARDLEMFVLVNSSVFCIVLGIRPVTRLTYLRGQVYLFELNSPED